MTVDPWKVPLPAELAEFDGMPSDDELERTITEITDRAEELTARVDARLAEAVLLDPVTPTRFRPENDAAAEWVARLGAAARRVIDADREQANEWHSQIERWENGRHRREKGTVAWATALLEGFALRQREADADHKTVSLPSAVVRTTETKPHPAILDGKADEFIMWALDNARSTLKHTPQVSKFRGIIELGDVLDGWDVQATLSCGHERTWFLPVPKGWDGSAPNIDDEVFCYECETGNPELMSMVASGVITPRLRTAVLSVESGEEVPGLVVDPGGISAKATF